MTRPTRKRRKVRDVGHRPDRRRGPGEYEPRTHLLMDPNRPPAPGPEARGEERERAVCASKQPYLSELLAGNAATLIALAGGGDRWPYDCPWCPDWHLTSHEPT